VGDGFHVTLKEIQQAQKFGLDMIILLSHTSHAFYSLDVKTHQNNFKKNNNV
jgi:hypothetical protein